MKITVINGTEKHGATYRLKEIFLERFHEKAVQIVSSKANIHARTTGTYKE